MQNGEHALVIAALKHKMTFSLYLGNLGTHNRTFLLNYISKTCSHLQLRYHQLVSETQNLGMWWWCPCSRNMKKMSLSDIGERNCIFMYYSLMIRQWLTWDTGESYSSKERDVAKQGFAILLYQSSRHA
jgi:hypothetical protein